MLINKTIPTICAYSMNLSLGLRPVIISTNVNRACPPSSAGMGNIFMKARIIEKIPVNVQNLSQSQILGNVLPMLITLPKLSLGLTFPEKICFSPVIYFVNVSLHLVIPSGIASTKVNGLTTVPNIFPAFTGIKPM